MSVEEETLKELVTKTLQNNGVLGKLQAQLRASVFLALEEEFKEKNIPLVSPSAKQLLSTREGAMAAALVQDFLQALNLDFSLSVFAPESGHSALWSFPGKDAMKKDLNLENRTDNSSPLLLEILKQRDLPKLSTSAESQNVKKLPPIMNLIEQSDNLRNTVNSKQLEDDKDTSENTVSEIEKQYEDDFFSMSDRNGRDEEEGEEEEEEDGEEIEEDDDIEEDISDLMNSSASLGSDQTKDQSISQVSDVPNYQEEL